MDYIANTKKIDKLPTVFPIVVYNGSDKWTAPTDLASLLDQAVDLGDYGVRCRYFKIVENSFSREQLLAIRNLISTLFLAEAHYDIELLIEEFVHLFEQESDKQAVSLLVNWFRQLTAYGRIQVADYAALEQEYHSAQEVRAMLIEALEKEKQQLRENMRDEVRDEVEIAAIHRMIEQILQRRLGELSPTVRERLGHCTLAQLNDLVNPALDAASWEEFVAALLE